MIKKKICILGAFAVGKTSLVEQFVKSVFSDKYHTTIGVKTDQKDVQIHGQDVRLILWDINGEDDYQHVKPSYLKGSSGFFVVADGTRKETLKVAKDLKQLVFDTIGEQEFILILNKADLAPSWEIKNADIEELQGEGWKVVQTSAKTGENVHESFEDLALKMLNK